MSEDTFSGYADDPLSLNLYTYCSNNPIIFIDPTGHVQVGDDKYIGLTSEIIRDATDAYYKAQDEYNKAKTNNDKAGMAAAKQNMSDAHDLAQSARDNADNLVNSGDQQFYSNNSLDTALSNGSVSRDEWNNIRESDHTGKGQYAVIETSSSTDINKKDTNRINDYKPVSSATYLISSNDAGGFGHSGIILTNSEGNGTLYTKYADQSNPALVFASAALGTSLEGWMTKAYMTDKDIVQFKSTGQFFSGSYYSNDGVLHNNITNNQPYFNNYLIIPVNATDKGAAMVKKAEEMYTDLEDTWSLYSNNCNHSIQQILATEGLNFTDTSANGWMVSMAIIGIQLKPYGTTYSSVDNYVRNWETLSEAGVIPNGAFNIGKRLGYVSGTIPK